MRFSSIKMVAWDRIELGHKKGHNDRKRKSRPFRTVLKLLTIKMLMAEPTALESATSNVTEQISSFQASLNY